MLKYLFSLLFVVGIAAGAVAQTEVDLAAQFTAPTVEGNRVGFRAQASMLNVIGPVRLGFQFSDAKNAEQEYGPAASLHLGTWNLTKSGKTVGLELFGWTNIAQDGIDLGNGVIGAGALVDLIPGNRIKESVKVLWKDDGAGGQDFLFSAGLRVELE